MKIEDILSRVDHTNLSPTATLSDIFLLCDEGMEYKTASLCLPQSYVKAASEYVDSRVKVCTVAGFPNGYQTTASKCFEASEAVKNGADEVDMVINIGWLKDKSYRDVEMEISAVKNACEGKILKVIIETCLLTDEEKIKMCEIVYNAGADYIKTSTGFSKGGASPHDIELFAKHKPKPLKIKAAGGIGTLCDAETFIKLGADRVGSSKIVKMLKETDGVK